MLYNYIALSAVLIILSSTGCIIHVVFNVCCKVDVEISKVDAVLSSMIFFVIRKINNFKHFKQHTGGL